MDERPDAQRRIEAELLERGEIALPATLVFKLANAKSYDWRIVRGELLSYLGWTDWKPE